MIKINGNDIYRDSQKIGYIDDNYIKSHDGDKLGYFDQKYVYDLHANKLAYIYGRNLVSQSDNDVKTDIDEINKFITGGVLSEIGRCAIYMLLGN